jgi:MurNAc alpha-1-phosphate uridylyltransferase
VQRGGAADHVFAGVSIATPRLMRDVPAGPFSLNRVWDRALAEGRLFGIALTGTWMHVGDPEALAAAEARLAQVGRDGEQAP